GDNILKLPAGVSFAVLTKPDAVWPTAPAKELGYRFNGYRLTTDDRPTFLYSCGEVRVEDFAAPIAGKEPTLLRTLRLSAAKPVDGLFFRAAVGEKITATGAGWYQVDGWKMKLSVAGEIRKSAGKMELLVPVRFTAGKAE